MNLDKKSLHIYINIYILKIKIKIIKIFNGSLVHRLESFIFLAFNCLLMNHQGLITLSHRSCFALNYRSMCLVNCCYLTQISPSVTNVKRYLHLGCPTKGITPMTILILDLTSRRTMFCATDQGRMSPPFPV